MRLWNVNVEYNGKRKKIDRRNQKILIPHSDPRRNIATEAGNLETYYVI